MNIYLFSYRKFFSEKNLKKVFFPTISHTFTRNQKYRVLIVKQASKKREFKTVLLISKGPLAIEHKISNKTLLS